MHKLNIEFRSWPTGLLKVSMLTSPESQYWTRTSSTTSGDLRYSVQFSSTFRELKVLGEKEKEHRYAVCQSLGRQGIAQRTMSEIEANFKMLNKNLLGIGQSLYHSKEVKELFVNVVDKVVKHWNRSR